MSAQIQDLLRYMMQFAHSLNDGSLIATPKGEKGKEEKAEKGEGITGAPRSARSETRLLSRPRRWTGGEAVWGVRRAANAKSHPA